VKAVIRDDWRRIADTAMLQRSTLWKKKKKQTICRGPAKIFFAKVLEKCLSLIFSQV